MGFFRGSLEDWSIAENLRNDGRSADAVEVLNTILGFSPGLDSKELDAILRSTLEGPEAPLEMLNVSRRGKEAAVVTLSKSRIPVGARQLGDLLVLRGICFIDRMDKETQTTQRGVELPRTLVVDAIANAELLAAYYPQDATRLALAAQVFLKINDWERFIHLLGSALSIDPKNELANKVLDFFSRVTEHFERTSSSRDLGLKMRPGLDYLQGLRRATAKKEWR